jgi:hypothetical protein
MLESPEFKDPEKIKKIMKEGVDAFKEVGRGSPRSYPHKNPWMGG